MLIDDLCRHRLVHKDVARAYLAYYAQVPKARQISCSTTTGESAFGERGAEGCSIGLCCSEESASFGESDFLASLTAPKRRSGETEAPSSLLASPLLGGMGEVPSLAG